MATRILRNSLSLVLAFTLTLSMGQDQDLEKTNTEIFEMFDVSLEDMMDVGMVSASKKTQSVLDAPATAYVVTEEEILTRGYRNLVELLQDIPEVELQMNSNPEFRNMLSFRSVSGNEKILILMNGFRITPATGDFYTLGSQFSLANAKRVEIILGPASALYGVDAFGGIINIITENHQGGESLTGVNITSSYGAFATQNTSFSAGTKVDKLSVSLTGHLHTSEEPKYYEYYPWEYAWYTDKLQPDGYILESPFYPEERTLQYFEENASGSFNGEPVSQEFEMPSRSYFINADLTYKDFNVGYIRHAEKHSTAHGVRPRFTTYDRGAFAEMTQDVIYLTHNFTSFDKKWNLQSSLRHSYFEINPESNFISAASRYQRGYYYSYAQSSKLQEQLQYDFNDNLSITAGFNYEVLSSLPRTGMMTVPFDKDQPAQEQDLYFVGAAGYDPQVANDTFNAQSTFTMPFFYLNYQNYGSYIQTQWAPSKKWQITAGTRYDYNTRFKGSLNPRFGLVFKPNKKLHFKFLYGEAFLAPSPTKAFMQGGAIYLNDGMDIYADFFRLPNPNLEPEDLNSLEFSAQWFITPNLSLAVNTFNTYINNNIEVFAYTTDPNFPGAPGNLSASKFEFSQNVGETDIFGLTARVNYLKKFGRMRARLYSSFSIIDGSTYDADFEDDALSEYFSFTYYQAYTTLKGGIDIMHPKFSLSIRGRLTGETYSNLEDPLRNKYYNTGYGVLNLTARYNIINKDKTHLSIFIKGSNITDNRYYNVYVGSDEGMPLTPQDPLRIDGGVTLKL